MDAERHMKEARIRESQRLAIRLQEAEHRRRVADCLDRWRWGEMGQAPDPTTARRAAP